MTDAVPVPENDARRIIMDAIGRTDTRVSPTDRDRITNDLASRLRFDHDGRRMLVADQHGHLLVNLAPDGSVVDVDLMAHVRTLASKAVPSAPAGDPANPWTKAGWSRTRQAILTNTKPAESARLKREAGL